MNRRFLVLALLFPILFYGCGAQVRGHMTPMPEVRSVAVDGPVFYEDFKYRGWRYHLINKLSTYRGEDAEAFVPFLRQELTRALSERGIAVTERADYLIQFNVVAPPWFLGNTYVGLFPQVFRTKSHNGGGEIVAEAAIAYSPGLFSDRTGVWAQRAIRALAKALAERLRDGESAPADQRLIQISAQE